MYMNTYDSQYMLLKETKLKQIINKEKTVIAVAKELNVSRQSVHKWLSRYKRFGIDGLTTRKKTGCRKAHNRTSAEIEQLVIQISKKYWNDGVETLHDHLLHKNNIELNPSTIYRILKRNDVRYTTNFHIRERSGRKDSMRIKYRVWNCKWIPNTLMGTNKAR